MNYIYLIIEVLIIFPIMVLFYKLFKKDGLYVYICFLSTLLGFLIIGTIDIFSFQINFSIPILMGLFLVSNIIIQRYGLDEIKRIMITFNISYIVTAILIGLISLLSKYGVDFYGNKIYDLLFGYSWNNIRVYIACIIASNVMFWLGGGIYYSIRKSKNILFVSNIVSTFVISFVESFIFVLIAYIGNFEFVELFGMISIRYIIEVIMGIFGLVPVYILVKFIDK